ncbi:group 1 truncated hemoglobin [Streptomyces sp. NPDC005202]|uniref:group I truncated hemoglobin n=1 Tax=Streptomyces sp. NPDC005202 TaxID=3157021 RepID=UPI00339F9DC4
MTDIVAGTPADNSTPSLIEQLGGEAAVEAVVDVFYAKVLADPDLEPYFAGVDIDRLKGHQRRFVGQALGATRPYSGRSMHKAHAHLSVTEGAFSRVVEHLAASLSEVGVDEATIGAVAEKLLPLKQDIVTA